MSANQVAGTGVGQEGAHRVAPAHDGIDGRRQRVGVTFGRCVGRCD
jgi:hypothetical protein